MANNTKIVGHVAFHHDAGQYLHFDPSTGRNFLADSRPEPVSRSDAHRRIAAWLEQDDENFDDFSVVAVFYEPSPLEKASAEMAGLLQGLCARHGLDLGLTREQMEAQIGKELSALKDGGASFIATGIPLAR